MIKSIDIVAYVRQRPACWSQGCALQSKCAIREKLQEIAALQSEKRKSAILPNSPLGIL
jgi:hypothetical protein